MKVLTAYIINFSSIKTIIGFCFSSSNRITWAKGWTRISRTDRASRWLEQWEYSFEILWLFRRSRWTRSNRWNRTKRRTGPIDSGSTRSFLSAFEFKCRLTFIFLSFKVQLVLRDIQDHVVILDLQVHRYVCSVFHFWLSFRNYSIRFVFVRELVHVLDHPCHQLNLQMFHQSFRFQKQVESFHWSSNSIWSLDFSFRIFKTRQ